MALKELEAVRRKVDSKDYHIENVPSGERDSTVAGKISCEIADWSFKGDASPKRVDLCIAYHLIQKPKLTAGQLRWCASLGTGFALRAAEHFGFAQDYDTAIENVSDVLRDRVKSVLDELVKLDRMVPHMARRSTRDDLVRTFIWLNPTGTGRFTGVKAAFDDAISTAHDLNPFKSNDD